MPLTPKGVKDATIDLNQIDRWWTQWPTANIGLSCKNCLVIDIDKKDGKSGSDDFEHIAESLGPIDSVTVATMPEAVDGQGGHNTTLSVANAIFWGFGLDEQTGWPILLDYNPRCKPPWSDAVVAEETERSYCQLILAMLGLEMEAVWGAPNIEATEWNPDGGNMISVTGGPLDRCRPGSFAFAYGTL